MGEATFNHTMEPRKQALTIHNVGEVDGTQVDIRFTPVEGKKWTSKIADPHKTVEHGIVKLNFRSTLKHEVQACVVKAGTTTEQTVKRFVVSFYDVDGWKGSKEVKDIWPVSTIDLPKNAGYTVEERDTGHYRFHGKGIGTDNPESSNPDQMTPAQISASLTATLENQSCFNIEVDLTHFSKVGGSRWIELSFKTVVPHLCTQAPTEAPTSAPTSACTKFTIDQATIENALDSTKQIVTVKDTADIENTTVDIRIMAAKGKTWTSKIAKPERTVKGGILRLNFKSGLKNELQVCIVKAG